MTMLRNCLLGTLLCLPLMACGGHDGAQASIDGASTVLGDQVRASTASAREKMAKGNITISNAVTPKAEITPAGDLLIEGTAVPINAEQRQLLLAYRGQIIQIAGAGMDLGVQGANLGLRAAGDAIKGVLAGNAEEVGDKVRAEADKIRDQALQLCDLVPAMRAQAAALAQSLPAFAPYAHIERTDNVKCLKHKDTNAAP